MVEDDKNAPAPEVDEDREAILKRRSRFVAAALAGIAGASLMAACSGEDASPVPCLSGPCRDCGDASDARPQPCLSQFPPDSGDSGDSGAPGDAGPDTGDDSGDASDAQPQPCLSPPPPDSGRG